ncbi:MAG: 4-hydroxy-tetrahydrodipicolinate synthase [Bacillota bacterium]|nr:4-hydroxy-tetrahydrodipicolinate synthase [Bacillota bacterium]
MEINGAYTALITPFNIYGDVDYKQLKENIAFQINNGIDGILALGTTAETPTLTCEEKEEILKICKETINGRVSFMIGTGTNSTATTIENTKNAERIGADIALIVTPYYNKPTQEGIYRHFESIVKSTNIPILVYNIKGRTGRNIETTTLERIAKLERVIGVKEASGDLSQIQEVISAIHLNNNNFNVMSGDDSLTLPLLSLGGNGVVSVISNLYPKEVSSMVRNYLNDNIAEALKIHNKLLPIMKGAFIETNPSPIKEAMKVRNMDSGIVRLPLVEMSNNNKELIKEIVEKL